MKYNVKALIVALTIIIAQFIFLLLKVTNVINWDYCWVLAPLWIPYLIFILGMSIIIIYVVLSNGIERIKNGLAQREKPGR